MPDSSGAANTRANVALGVGTCRSRGDRGICGVCRSDNQVTTSSPWLGGDERRRPLVKSGQRHRIARVERPRQSLKLRLEGSLQCDAHCHEARETFQVREEMVTVDPHCVEVG